MKHALIIGHDHALAELIEHRLWDAGYHSLIHALDACEARAILPTIKPSLIVLISDAASTVSTDELYRLSNMAETPVLVATGAPARALACLGGKGSLIGPYPVSGIAQAIAAAAYDEPVVINAA